MSSSTSSSSSSFLTSESRIQEIVSRFDNFLFDCDGVLWEGNSLLPGVYQTIQFLRDQGKRIFFVTNNSAKSRVAYLSKFEKLGLQVKKEEVYSSSSLVASYVKHHFPAIKKVYVVGERGIVDEMAELGIESVGAESHKNMTMSEEEFTKAQVDPEIGAVVCGFDSLVNYYKFCYASICLQELPDCQFIATNTDPFLMMGNRAKPGAGTVVTALSTCTGLTPTVVGKPSLWVIESIHNDANIDLSRTVMVGDRIDTDMEMGKQAKIGTLLVLTGVATLQQVEELAAKDPSSVPDFVLTHLGALIGHPRD